MSNEDDKTPKTQTDADGQPPKSSQPIALGLHDGLPVPQKVLLIDDDDAMRTLLSMMLKRASKMKVSIVEADNASKALSILEETQDFDTIMVDYMLPGMNGVDLIRNLREKPELEGVTIIMLSARGDSGVQIEATDAGADAYVLKPLKVNDVSQWFNK